MSETATQLIATARDAGIMLWVERGALKFRAPAGPELSQFSDPGFSRLLLWCRGLCGVGR